MSGTEFLLDSNIVIGLLKNHPETVELARQAGLTLTRASVSQISRMELLGFPAITEQEEQSSRAFLSLCQVIHIDDAIEAQAIRLRRSGALKLPDAIIAATAITTGAKLLTLDHRLAGVMAGLGHFPAS